MKGVLCRGEGVCSRQCVLQSSSVILYLVASLYWCIILKKEHEPFLLRDPFQVVTDLTNESKHVTCNIPFRKSGSSVCEKVLPFSFESSIIRIIPECWVIFYDRFLCKAGF